MAALTISQLAGEVGVSTDTLRYYEKVGLLAPSGRTASGYRFYADGAVERLRLIKGAQRSGLRLHEVLELLEIKDRGGCPCGHTQEMLRRRIPKSTATGNGWRSCVASSATCWKSPGPAPTPTPGPVRSNSSREEVMSDDEAVSLLWLPLRRAAVPVLR
jgi:DNA-binding transcriptional MerR regulator